MTYMHMGNSRTLPLPLFTTMYTGPNTINIMLPQNLHTYKLYATTFSLCLKQWSMDTYIYPACT